MGGLLGEGWIAGLELDTEAWGYKKGRPLGCLFTFAGYHVGIHTHPALVEILKEAVLDAAGSATHVKPKEHLFLTH